MGGATGLDSRVARETRLWTSALHSICRFSSVLRHSTVTCACCFVYRTVHATLLRSHPSCDSFAARTLCDLARAAELAQRDETRRVLYAMYVGASRETGLPSATQAQRVVHTRLTVVLLHKGLRA